MLAEIHVFLSQIWQESVFCKMKQKVPVKQMLSCRKKRFSGAKVLSQTDIFLRKKCLATERNFLPQEDFFIISRNFLSQEEISCHRKKFLVTGRIFMLQEIYFTVKKYLREEIVWPKTFLFNWKSIKSIYPMGKLLKQKKEVKV